MVKGTTVSGMSKYAVHSANGAMTCEAVRPVRNWTRGLWTHSDRKLRGGPTVESCFACAEGHQEFQLHVSGGWQPMLKIEDNFGKTDLFSQPVALFFQETQSFVKVLQFFESRPYGTNRRRFKDWRKRLLRSGEIVEITLLRAEFTPGVGRLG